MTISPSHGDSGRPEACPTCNRYTTHGLQQLAVQTRSRPIYGTDFSKPLSVVIEDIRSQLVRARGQLSDIGSGYTGWRDRVEDVQGLLTCGLIALHRVKTEMEDHERRWPEANNTVAGRTPSADGSEKT